MIKASFVSGDGGYQAAMEAVYIIISAYNK